MAPHQIRVTDPAQFSGILTLGGHPDGALAFEDGVATVGDAALADRLVDRYANLAHADGDVSATDDGADDADAEPGPAPADPPLDPGEYTVDELRDALGDGGGYTLAELEAIHTAEAQGQGRATALDAIDARREATTPAEGDGE